ncbi:preprotein translocase subunit SecA [Marinitenerispora sediminis]|uniref:Protein translocase subunit SecA n=1 Tax=Marinitenerispora sediminis TaxID=1931232 RepID=A0A368T351_9ACTN|nr:preprotein translocase subunit SecA [Marinitenerispora sediminis]RCV55708.1 preprotein translocase subunit SecA [Marinitenerispora sediminis]RCV56729.1 preprotein translocase subunit SecA [Marinitenerispora sediminis]RCV56758.1 preprotein translocase subunit SecA [Marinitenerispora sediminis]
MPGILDKVLRAGEGKILRKLKKLKDQINSIEDDFVDLSDTELRELTEEFRQRHKDGESLDDLLPEAFATVREAAKRTLGQRHFDVQLMGGAALHLGNIAEMKTGEGKTLTSTLAVYLNALAGRGVHVVTVNDYLARRDAESMGRIYQFLGLEVGVIVPEMSQADRRKAYAADITYGTNNEFGFDYLRDNMALSIEDCVQREHYFAIVDEVDSILIDEARTPLIISGPAEQNSRWYAEFAKIAPRLRRDVDYEVDEKKRTVGITESGVEKVEDWLGIENLYESVNTPLISFLNNSLKAKELYRRDKEYIVKDGEVLIVDEFTGRVLRGRRYNEGMHQAIEAKEKVRIKDENQTLAKVTLQNYFRLYEKLAGMTGTASTEAAEFNQTYNIGVVPIPTNKPMVRSDERDVVYKSEESKFAAVVDDIAECYENGQPVLVGTTSVEKSELLSKLLKRRGVAHEVLNAKNHAREAAIVARAGKLKAVTVATNMAGRGTDIMLGGNPDFIADEELQARGLSPLETPEEYEEAWPEALEKARKEVESEHEQVVEAGGLYVLGTERHESRRIDNQLRGRSGRQGDPGRSRFYLSLQDDLMRLFNSARVEIIMDRLNIPDDQPIESGVVSKAIQSAQGQVEQQNFEIRKNVLKYDEVLNRQRKVVYAERRKVLEGADLKEQVQSMIDDVLQGYVRVATAEGDPEDWDLDRLWKAFKQVYPVSFTSDDLIEEHGGELGTLTPDIIIQRVSEDAQEAYERREEELGADTMREVERRVILQVMDRKWREHLYEMDYLQEGIGLRAMAQRNPLIEYQREGYDMFQEMLEGIKEESVGFLFNVEVQVRSRPQAEAGALTASSAAATAAAVPVQPAAAEEGAAEPEAAAAAADEEEAVPAGPVEAPERRPDVVVPGFGAGRPSHLQYSAPAEDGTVERHSESADDEYGDVPRNAPCPCGSGKKFKKCHGDPANR